MPAVQPTPPSEGPSRTWYLVPVLILLLLGGPSVYALVDGLNNITGLTRVRAPGDSQITLEEGTWLLFYEWRGEFEGEDFTTSSAFPGMLLSLTSSGGDEIAIQGLSGANFDYHIGDHEGFGIAEFVIPSQGTYLFSAEMREPGDNGPYVLMFGEDIPESTVLVTVGIIGVIAGALFALVAWLIIFVLRSRAKKRMQTTGYAS